MFGCFERSPHFCLNKISPQCLCRGWNLRRGFPEECFTSVPNVSTKINTPIRNTNFYETKKIKKHSYIKQHTHLVKIIDVDTSLCCETGWFDSFLVQQCLLKIDRISFSMVLSILTFTLSTIYSFTKKIIHMHQLLRQS